MSTNRPGGQLRATDRYGADQRGHERVRSVLLATSEAYGYQPIGVPVVEQSDLYLLKAGETIAAQLCELVSRKRLSLRPEHTASVVRAYVESLRKEPLPLRLSYAGPVFRWLGGMAAPRQYHEMGVELLGLGGLAGDAELLALASRSLVALGLREFQPRIGQVGIMQHYLDSLGLDRRLSAFLLAHREILRDEGSTAMLELLRERLPEFRDAAVETNGLGKRRQLRDLLAPLADEDAHAVLRDFLSLTQLAEVDDGAPDDDDIERLLAKLQRADSSSQLRQAIRFIEELVQLTGEPVPVIAEARQLLRRYDQDTAALAELEALLASLEAAEVGAGAGWQLDLGLSRGLHYYSGMIFEVFHGEGDGATRVGGGGRYDGLIELFGGPSTPACGFSFGLERLVAAQFREGAREDAAPAPHTLVASAEEWAMAFLWAEKLRAAGCAVAMVAADSAVESARAIRYIDGEGPAFHWLVDGERAEALGWKETLARLAADGSQADG